MGGYGFPCKWKFLFIFYGNIYLSCKGNNIWILLENAAWEQDWLSRLAHSQWCLRHGSGYCDTLYAVICHQNASNEYEEKVHAGRSFLVRFIVSFLFLRETHKSQQLTYHLICPVVLSPLLSAWYTIFSLIWVDQAVARLWVSNQSFPQNTLIHCAHKDLQSRRILLQSLVGYRTMHIDHCGLPSYLWPSVQRGSWIQDVVPQFSVQTLPDEQ